MQRALSACGRVARCATVQPRLAGLHPTTVASAAVGLGLADRAMGGWVRQLHSTRAAQGLEEFFPPGLANDHATAGRAWKARDLRIKSNVELHQLWYVLLKERNMLLTVKQDAKMNTLMMPAPERLKKVRESMRSVKVVIGERDRAAAQAAAADPEVWEGIRAQAEPMDTGIRPKVGSEKKGRVARAVPKLPADVEQADGEFAQLVGVNRPAKALPGQPQRPMTKAERTTFRRALQDTRAELLESKVLAVREEVHSLEDEALAVLVSEGELELREGWEPEDLDQRHLTALHEGYARGFDTIFEPAQLPDDQTVKGRNRFRHGLRNKRKGLIKQKVPVAPIKPLNWQSYINRRKQVLKDTGDSTSE